MISGYIEEMGKKAKEASKKLLTLDTRIKNKALVMIAEELINKKEEIKEALNNNIYSPQMDAELDKLKEEFSLYVADNDYEIISLNADNLDRIKRVAKRYVDVDLEDDLINEYLQGILERINCNE